jgi:PiT family inorganic phosphate transporter
MTLTMLFISVCFLAYSNGANDNFKGVASLYGSGTASYRSAMTWATVATLTGSICAWYLAQSLLVKFSGKGLAPDSIIQTIPFMTAVAAGAGMTVILATRLGFPVSTTHALLGAITGSALSATMGDIDLSVLEGNFILPLLLSPLLALILAIVIYSLLRNMRRRIAIDNPLCLCLETESAEPEIISREAAAMALPSSRQLAISIDNQFDCSTRYAGVLLGIEIQRAVDVLHFISAGTVCFARGLNDTPKIAALLLLAPALKMQWIIVLVAFLMALGGLLNARRVAETLSHKITTISRGQGLAANLTTSLLVIFASKFGIPVSTTHVSVGALFGIGLQTGKANGSTIISILLSWLLTLPCAALCAAGIYALSRLAD